MGEQNKIPSHLTAGLEQAAEDQKENQQVIISLLRQQNKISKSKADELIKIRQHEEAKALNDSLWRNKWSKQKNITIALTTVILVFTLTGFLLNVIKLNEHSAVVKGIADFLSIIGNTI